MSNGFNEKGVNMAENNPAISVIIPMYNVEKYVAECLTSLANQTFQDFEIIVVDDCSTDNSLQIVKGFSSKFGDRLKFMKLSKNSGYPGIPRNFALKTAHGKYIYFLDSDDFLSETAFEDLYNVAKNFNADVVHAEKCFAFVAQDDKIESEIISNQMGEFVTEPTLETSDIGERIGDFIGKKYLWWACNKLFLRKFLVDNDIKFVPTKTFEDMIFTFMCIVKAKVYVRVPFVSYYYRLRKDSLSRNAKNIVEIIERAFAVFNALDKFTDEQKFFKENPRYKFNVLDFFMQERLEFIAKFLFVTSNSKPAEIFNLFKEKFFVGNPKKYISLMTYLFISTNILKLYSKQQEEEISALKHQIDTLKQVISELVLDPKK